MLVPITSTSPRIRPQSHGIKKQGSEAEYMDEPGGALRSGGGKIFGDLPVFGARIHGMYRKLI